MMHRTSGTRLRSSAIARDEDLEALLVLDPSPRHDERLALAGRRRQLPERRVDAVGHQVDLLHRELEAADDLADHEPRTRDHLASLVGEPPLDRVDRRRHAHRDVAAVPAPLGRVDRGHERQRPTASSACRRPTPPASRGRGRRRGASRRAVRPSPPADGSPTPCGPRGRRRATRAGRSRRGRTRTPSTTSSSATSGAPGSCRWRLITTTSWPARAIALVRPSTCAAMPPTTNGGYSHESMSTRIAATVVRWPTRAALPVGSRSAPGRLRVCPGRLSDA